MSSLNQDSTVSGRYRIVDSLQAPLLLVFSVVAFCFAYWLIYEGARIGGLIAGLIGVAPSQAFRVNAKGYVADVETDTLEYTLEPGNEVFQPGVVGVDILNMVGIQWGCP